MYILSIHFTSTVLWSRTNVFKLKRVVVIHSVVSKLAVLYEYILQIRKCNIILQQACSG